MEKKMSDRALYDTRIGLNNIVSVLQVAGREAERIAYRVLALGAGDEEHQMVKCCRALNTMEDGIQILLDNVTGLVHEAAILEKGRKK
jgi:hypothetical protein